MRVLSTAWGLPSSGKPHLSLANRGASELAAQRSSLRCSAVSELLAYCGDWVRPVA